MLYKYTKLHPCWQIYQYIYFQKIIFWFNRSLKYNEIGKELVTIYSLIYHLPSLPYFATSLSELFQVYYGFCFRKWRYMESVETAILRSVYCYLCQYTIWAHTNLFPRNFHCLCCKVIGHYGMNLNICLIRDCRYILCCHSFHSI